MLPATVATWRVFAVGAAAGAVPDATPVSTRRRWRRRRVDEHVRGDRIVPGADRKTTVARLHGSVWLVGIHGRLASLAGR
jgi:hypothetical protein